MNQTRESEIGTIDLEIVRNRESSIMKRQADTIENISGQPLHRETSDYSCAILDPDGEIVGFHAFFLPHIGSLSAMVKATLDEYDRDDLNPNDVFLCNDPYGAGGLHQPDVGAISPIFDSNDEIVCWIADLAHISDVGGFSPGAFSPVPTEVVQEAIRIPPVKIYDQGEWQDDLFRFFQNNVRTPERVGLDVKGVIGAAYETIDMMNEVVDEYGGEYIRQIHEELLNRSENQAQGIIDDLPDGRYSGRAYLESDHVSEKIYKIVCDLTVNGQELTVDFTKSSAQAPAGGVNTTEVGLIGSVGSMIATQICSGEPFTGGSMRPVEIVSEKGTIVDAEYPAPVSAASIATCYYTMDAMLDALNKPMLASSHEDRAAGTWSTWSTYLFACINQLGDPWIGASYEGGSGGGGAFPHQDGEDVIGSSSTITAVLPNIEGQEEKNPMLYLFRRYLPDSGGPGRQRGGNGLETGLILHKDQSNGMELTTHLNGKSIPGFGVMGGHPGGGTKIGRVTDTSYHNMVKQGNRPEWDEYEESVELFPTRDAEVPVATDQGIYLQTKPGGGYGDPLDRSPEMVRQDVHGGQITRDTAEDVYGVVLVDGHVDGEATQERREKLREERAKKGDHS